jgi:hypothetical protein
LLHLGGTTNTSAGNYPADGWTFDGNTNYKAASGTVHDVIDQAVAHITVTPYHVTYDGSAHTATGSATGVESSPADLSSLLHLGGTTNTSAGDYPADGWTFDGNTNYKAASGTVHDVIAKATPSVSITWAGWTFDGSAHAASGSVSGVGSPAANLGSPSSFTYFAGPDTSGANLGGSAPTNAGTYTAVAHYGGGANYNAADSPPTTVTVAKATPSVSISWTGWTFDGAAHPASGAVSGVGSPAANLGSPSSFTYYVGASPTGTPLSGAPIAPGTYTAIAHYAGGTNYNPADSTPTTVTVIYKLCLLYDSSKSFKAGSTAPLKIYLCDANGAGDYSSSTIVVTATSLHNVDSTPDPQVTDAGNANPDNNFRYDSTLGPSGGYIFNLSTKSPSPALGHTTALGAGTWTLSLTINGAVYSIQFDVK